MVKISSGFQISTQISKKTEVGILIFLKSRQAQISHTQEVTASIPLGDQGWQVVENMVEWLKNG